MFSLFSQIKCWNFLEVLKFLHTIRSEFVLMFLKANFSSNFFNISQDMIDLVLFMFYNFSMLLCQVDFDYTPYMYCSIFAQSLSSHSFHIPKYISFILPFISTSFILLILDHLIHIYHIGYQAEIRPSSAQVYLDLQ